MDWSKLPSLVKKNLNNLIKSHAARAVEKIQIPKFSLQENSKLQFSWLSRSPTYEIEKVAKTRGAQKPN